MVREIMTVHKALAELKLLDERINKALIGGVYCAANKHSNDKINGVSIEEYKNIIQGSYDKVDGLIRRQSAIKRAVTLSNAITKVKVANKEYVVAEAIWMRNHGTERLKQLVDCLNKQYKSEQAKINKQNGADLEARADQYVTAIYGQKDGKTNTADIEKVRSDFLTANTYELLDPIKILDKIETLENEISDFMSEVDSALSCSNALTEITIEY